MFVWHGLGNTGDKIMFIVNIKTFNINSIIVVRGDQWNRPDILYMGTLDLVTCTFIWVKLMIENINANDFYIYFRYNDYMAKFTCASVYFSEYTYNSFILIRIQIVCLIANLAFKNLTIFCITFFSGNYYQPMKFQPIKF